MLSVDRPGKDANQLSNTVINGVRFMIFTGSSVEVEKTRLSKTGSASKGLHRIPDVSHHIASVSVNTANVNPRFYVHNHW